MTIHAFPIPISEKIILARRKLGRSMTRHGTIILSAAGTNQRPPTCRIISRGQVLVPPTPAHKGHQVNNLLTGNPLCQTPARQWRPTPDPRVSRFPLHPTTSPLTHKHTSILPFMFWTLIRQIRKKMCFCYTLVLRHLDNPTMVWFDFSRHLSDTFKASRNHSLRLNSGLIQETADFFFSLWSDTHKKITKSIFYFLINF